jgi:hypothetical protein
MLISKSHFSVVLHFPSLNPLHKFSQQEHPKINVSTMSHILTAYWKYSMCVESNVNINPWCFHQWKEGHIFYVILSLKQLWLYFLPVLHHCSQRLAAFTSAVSMIVFKTGLSSTQVIWSAHASFSAQWVTFQIQNIPRHSSWWFLWSSNNTLNKV